MTKNSISYPKVCKDKHSKYWIDFKLNNKRIRMFNGRRINSSTAPNTFPIKHRRKEALKLAREVFEYLASNNFSFLGIYNKIEQFDKIVEKNLMNHYHQMIKRCLKDYRLYFAMS